MVEKDWSEQLSLLNQEKLIRPYFVKGIPNFFSFQKKRWINFSSNDYLGLAKESEVIKTLQKASEKYGLGSGSSPWVSGLCSSHHALEQALAVFLKRDRALLFNSGYIANLAVLSTILHKDTFIFYDRACHASIVDGIRLSGSLRFRYPHFEPDLFKRKMVSHRHHFWVTEGIFSMSGHAPSLPTYSQFSQENGLFFILDDAHGFGCLGPNGGGSCDQYGLTQKQVPLMIIPFGKALGSSGAAIVGSETTVEFIRQKARGYGYSTAQSPLIAEATLTALHLLQTQPWRRTKLFQLIAFFKKKSLENGLSFLPSDSPIQSFLVHNNEKALKFQEKLLERNFLVAAIRPPSVPSNSARIRISLTYHHSEEEIEAFLNAFKEIYYDPSH